MSFEAFDGAGNGPIDLVDSEFEACLRPSLTERSKKRVLMVGFEKVVDTMRWEYEKPVSEKRKRGSLKRVDEWKELVGVRRVTGLRLALGV